MTQIVKRATRLLPATRPPTAGSLVVLDRDATPQLDGSPAVTMRVVRVEPGNQEPGWLWISGYQLVDAGVAVEQRTILAKLNRVWMVVE